MSGLRAKEVWKAYPRWQPGARTVRGVVTRRMPLLVRRGERRWALEDVSLTVAPGEAVGVVGHNGAGKSTLLRLCSGLGRPTRGEVAVPRQVASVLALGSWFDFTLTGRENALTAAVVLGWSRGEAGAVVPAALEFAELAEYADSPVRVYSDGMRLRLAFGVLAQLQPSVLVIDEALAVGDLAFQERCVARIREMRERGTSLLLASHDLDQVARECDRAVWLHRGRVRFAGAAGEAVRRYREAGREETLARTPPPTAEAPDLGGRRLGSQEVTLERGEVLAEGAGCALPAGSPLAVRLRLRPRRGGIEDVRVVVAVHRDQDDVLCYEAASPDGAVRLGGAGDEVEVGLDVERLDLVPGDYFLAVGVYREDWEYAYDYRWRWRPLRVTGPPGGHGVLAAGHAWHSHPAA